MAVDGDKIAKLLRREQKTFIEANPQSEKLYKRATGSLAGGVPMPWMTEWASPFPLFIDHASGAKVFDVDGHEYVDFCLGDTGALFGHSPAPIADAVVDQANRGYSFMLPTEDSIRVAEELQRRFGLPCWQFATTATDANRFAIKLARTVTSRSLIAVFNGGYHGSLDETLVTLEGGVMQSMRTNLGPGVNPQQTTRIVEFNDLEALEAVLAEENISCLLCEPVLTNSGLVFPQAGFHDEVRRLTRKYGSLLIIDETHTICAGPGGVTRQLGLEPDIITLGKPLSGGIPAAVYGYSEAIANAVTDWSATQHSFVTGIGGTLAGNAFSMRAMRACLEQVMTDAAYQAMFEKAERLVRDLESIIDEYKFPWRVDRLGARIEYSFQKNLPTNATEASQAADKQFEQLFRLFFLNRGLLLTIFYNVALVSPETEDKDIRLHSRIFREFGEALRE